MLSILGSETNSLVVKQKRGMARYNQREFNNSACCDALDNKDLTITLAQWIIVPYEANERGYRVLPQQCPQTD